MSVLISLVVSDRNEMEGVAGLHAEVLLKRGLTGRTFAIVGTTVLSDEMKIAAVTIVEDALGLGNEMASVLVRAAFDFCWQAVVIGDCASAGMRWRPLDAFVITSLDPNQAENVVRHIQAAF